jgi:hypothetical protein
MSNGFFRAATFGCVGETVNGGWKKAMNRDMSWFESAMSNDFRGEKFLECRHIFAMADV